MDFIQLSKEIYGEFVYQEWKYSIIKVRYQLKRPNTALFETTFKDSLLRKTSAIACVCILDHAQCQKAFLPKCHLKATDDFHNTNYWCIHFALCEGYSLLVSNYDFHKTWVHCFIQTRLRCTHIETSICTCLYERKQCTHTKTSA